MSWIKNNEWLKPDEDHAIRWHVLRRFIANFRPMRIQIASAAGLALLGAAATFSIPLIFRQVQASITERSTELLVLSLLAFLAIILLEVGTTYGIRIIHARISTRLSRDLLIQYYRKILNLSVEEFIAFKRRSNLFQRIVDAMSITGEVADVLVRGGQLAISAIVIGLVIGLVSGPVLGILAAGSAILFAHTLIRSRELTALRRLLLSVNYPLVGKMTEVLSGLLTIKALAASVRVTSDITALVDKKADAELRELGADIRAQQISQAIRAVTLVAVLGMSAAYMLAGALSVADVLALYLLTQLFLQPVSELAIYCQRLSRLSVNVERFYGVLDLQDEAEAARLDQAARDTAAARQDSNGALRAPASVALSAAPVGLPFNGDVGALPGAATPPAGHIQFRNVAFAYRGGKDVLSGINLDILPGEKISLIGRSGAGKTTLMRLLLGFLQPRCGKIRVDEFDIVALEDKNDYRRRFGVVSQQDFFFDTSLRENLAFGLDERIPEGDIDEALRLVDLADGVRRLERGLDTTYSEDLFSGGQKQRLFIARALLRQPFVVLLDEPTSALDFESEQQVMQALDTLVGNRTTITIAHRLSTVRNADRVVVLQEGRITADGPHDHLYESNEYYRSLCDYNSFVV